MELIDILKRESVTAFLCVMPIPIRIGTRKTPPPIPDIADIVPTAKNNGSKTYLGTIFTGLCIKNVHRINTAENIYFRI